MSAAASGNDSWMWMAFFRLAEPLIQKVDRVVDEPENDRMLMFPGVEVASFPGVEEDAERWDGMA